MTSFYFFFPYVSRCVNRAILFEEFLVVVSIIRDKALGSLEIKKFRRSLAKLCDRSFLARHLCCLTITVIAHKMSTVFDMCILLMVWYPFSSAFQNLVYRGYKPRGLRGRVSPSAIFETR